MSYIKNKPQLNILLLCALLSAPVSAVEENAIGEMLKSGEFAKAQVQLEQVTPRDLQAQLQYARALSGKGDQQAAKDLLHKLLDDYPDQVEVLNNLALVYIKEKNYEQATILLNRALNSDERYRVIYANLSKLYTLLASEAYKKALGSTGTPELESPPFEAFNRLHAARQASPLPPTPPPAPSVESMEAEIINSVRGWADAWSAQDVQSYLDYYSPEFLPDDGLSLEDWKQQRRERLTAPQFIRLFVSGLDVKLLGQGEVATVRFLQEYESNTFHEKILKRLLMHKMDKKWRILEEGVEIGG